MKKKLHELIEMAKSGCKFHAKYSESEGWLNEYYIRIFNEWSSDSITADWDVRMDREPRVIWATYIEPIGAYKIWDSKEHAEPFGTPIKFIEVMDESHS